MLVAWVWPSTPSRTCCGTRAKSLPPLTPDGESPARPGASLPWTSFLPDDECEEFFDALTSTAAAFADVDSFKPLAHLIAGWRATAEVHANQALAELLNVEHSVPAAKVKRPKAE